MKLRYFSLLALVLVGCTDASGYTTNGKVYQNVDYSFDYENHYYVVYVNFDDEKREYEHEYYVPPKNYYVVNYYVEFVHNEYFVSTNELFVYSV